MCLLCDQADEIIQHILVSCVFSRQVWTMILQRLDLLPLTFCLSFLQLVVQCYKRSSQGFEEGFETFNSLIILVAWEIWKQRNSCVFEEARPNVQVATFRLNGRLDRLNAV